jgi:YYY domain-containing protein
MSALLGLFLLVEAVGLLAAPLVALVLGRLPGAGLGFAKIFGLLLVTWLVWITASLGIAPYGRGLIVGVLVLVAVAGVLVALRLKALGDALEEGGSKRRMRRLARRALPPDDKVRIRLFWGAELVFVVAFALGVLMASLAPDVWGTEKPMDMAFIAAINASDSFPPHDPWMSGETLNYYYFGHMAFAWPSLLLGLEPDKGYLLSWGLLVALTATTVYAFAGTLWAAARAALGDRAPRGGPVAAGVVGAVLVTVLGNLAGVRTWLRASDPPADYAWFEPSRVIPNTINETPVFSFVLGDLHAHVLALPFTVLALAFALQVCLRGPRGDLLWRAVAEALAAGLAVGALYAINSWSYPVVAGVLAAAVVVSARTGGRRGYPAVWLVLVLLAGAALFLPFILNFDPEGRGVGVVSTRREFGAWLGDMALIYGTLFWLLAPAFFGRWAGSRHRWRWLGWGFSGAIVAGSLLAADQLTGAMVVGIATCTGIVAALAHDVDPPTRFLWILIAGGMFLLFIPEVLYLRDAFDNGDLERMNTVFKAGFQAYLLLGLAAACALPWAAVWLPRHAWTPWALGAAILLLLGLVYPYAGSYARTGGYARAPSLDGLRWLRERASGDPGAIAWLRANAPGDAVVLEAVGGDYSEFGHGRISTFSGRPTVLGWAGHEIQWQHDPGTRGADVETLYKTTDVNTARALIERYGIRYVVAGPLETTTYGDGGYAKFNELGRRVYSERGTTIWELDAAG